MSTTTDIERLRRDATRLGYDLVERERPWTEQEALDAFWLYCAKRGVLLAYMYDADGNVYNVSGTNVPWVHRTQSKSWMRHRNRFPDLTPLGLAYKVAGWVADSMGLVWNPPVLGKLEIEEDDA